MKKGKKIYVILPNEKNLDFYFCKCIYTGTTNTLWSTTHYNVTVKSVIAQNGYNPAIGDILHILKWNAYDNFSEPARILIKKIIGASK